MIFVTVGTHEQQFDRLIKKIDELRKYEKIKEDVIIQTGYSSYIPKCCRWSKFLSFEEMLDNIKNARIVITHGGPSSFMQVLQEGKVPVVVPRLSKFGEHVNDHQMDFANAVSSRYRNIIVISNINDLENVIINYASLVEKLNYKISKNNECFCKNFGKIVDELFQGEYR